MKFIKFYKVLLFKVSLMWSNNSQCFISSF